MSARNIADTFGGGSGYHTTESGSSATTRYVENTLPDPIRSALPDRPDKEFEIVHAVYPRRVGNPKRKDAQHMKWASCYVFRSTKTILSEGGYEEFPYLVPRWDKESEGIYGYGPGHIALPDIRTLSRAIELGLSAASKALDPPGLVNSDAVFGELDLRPAAQTPVDGDPRRGVGAARERGQIRRGADPRAQAGREDRAHFLLGPAPVAGRQADDGDGGGAPAGAHAPRAGADVGAL